MFRLRSIIISALVTALCLALAGSALASPTVVRSSGWVPVAPPGAYASDCYMLTQLENDATTGYTFSRGTGWCSGNHSIGVTQYLKRVSPSGAVTTFSSIFTPMYSPGGLWVYTPYSYQNGCEKWQSVTTVKIDGVASNYVTSGAPVKFLDHCPY
jgi:hypothetical protein